ncbi:MAG: LCP family protein [Actinobacteria bacterium]|nr:LCP family protein [Actinomycetota bacterium]
MEFTSDDPPGSAPGDAPSTRQIVAVVAIGVVALVIMAAAGLALFTESQIARYPIEAIEERGQADGAGSHRRAGEDEGHETLNILVVGSDSREGLSEAERDRLTTGPPQGPPRTDTILLVHARPEEGVATIVSIPRDLKVELPGSGPGKINAAVARGGPDLLVRIVERLSGFDIDHYVEVSIPSFLTVVEAVGGVEVCLREPLVDDKSGADLRAGCQHLDAVEALAYVRSREGARGDFRRIHRQQRFLKALANEATSAGTLANVPRVVRIADRVASSLTTDEDFGLTQLRFLAEQFRGMASGDVQTATVPAYAQTIQDTSYVVPYRPGVRALFERLAEGGRLGPRGTARQRQTADVVVWNGQRGQTVQRVESVLYFAGFQPRREPPATDVEETVVYAASDDEIATWIGSILGAPVRPLPPGVPVRDDTDAVVAVSQ